MAGQMEQGFQETCELHNGKLLEGGLIPRTDLKIFQPFMRFENGKHGIIFGLAAIPEPKVIPVKNKSRVAGVSLNFHLSPRLDLDGSGPKVGDIFALLLVARDREQAGKIEEVAVGVIDSKYESYLFYEPLEVFLSGHADKPKFSEAASSTKRGSAVSLKKKITPFVPPEAPAKKDETGTE